MSQNRTQIIFFSVFTIILFFPMHITLGDKSEISIEPNDQFEYIIGKENTFLGTIKITTSDGFPFNFTLVDQEGSTVVTRKYEQNILFHFMGKGNYTIQIRNSGANTLKINLIVEIVDLTQESSEKYFTDNDSVCWQILVNEDYYIISLESLKYGDYDAYVDVMGGIGNVRVYVTQADPETVEDWFLYSDTYIVTTGAFLRKFSVDDDSKYWICIKSNDDLNYQITLTLVLTSLKKDNGTVFFLTAAALIAMLTLYSNKQMRKRSMRKSATALKAKEKAIEEFKNIRLQDLQHQYYNVKFKK